MLITLIIITSLLLIGLAISVYKREEDGIGFFGALLILDGIFGWAFLGTVLPVEHVKLVETATVLKEPTAIHLSVDGKIVQTYTDVASYALLSNTNKIQMEVITYKNMYGGMLNKKYEFPNVN